MHAHLDGRVSPLRVVRGEGVQDVGEGLQRKRRGVDLGRAVDESSRTAMRTGRMVHGTFWEATMALGGPLNPAQHSLTAPPHLNLITVEVVS
jgi:hypothetical protein